jgi:hypothetical protein
MGGEGVGGGDLVIQIRLVFLCILVTVIYLGIKVIVHMEFPNNGMYESKWGCFSKTNILHTE